MSVLDELQPVSGVEPVATFARRLSATLGEVRTSLLDLLYPPRCAACGAWLRSTAEEPFCPDCEEALLPLPPGCEQCGEPGPLARCGACIASPPAFDSCRAAGLLGGPLADAVHAFKYRDEPWLARPLGAWLAREVQPAPGALVVSVPLARRRRLTRGYDQAALLGRAFARAGGGTYLPGALARVRETPPQVGRDRTARRASVRGAFAPRWHRERLSGGEVVLVDDVVTTGATAGACAQALRAAGAASVAVVALARTL